MRIPQLLVLVAVFAGCGNARQDGGEQAGDSGESRWSVAPRPAVEIGTGESDALHQVTSAARLPDGRIVVLNAGTQQVRYFSADGRHLASVGRAGGGPGEFQFPMWMGVRGDSVLVWDAGLQRLSVFDPTGRFVRDVAPALAGGLFPAVVGQYPGGLVLTSGVDPASAGASAGKRWRPRMALLRVTLQGEVHDTLTIIPGTERYATNSADGLTVEDLPLGRRTVIATHGGRVYLGTGDGYRIRAIDSVGAEHEIIRSSRQPRKVSAADIRDYRERMVTLGSRSREEQPQNGEPPRPDELPPYDDLAVDASGYIWVKEAQLPREWDDPDAWSIYSPSGRLHARIQLPPRLRIQQVGDDYILATALDAQHRETVRLYPYRRS